MSETEIPKYARGARPQFFDNPAIDALLVAVLELTQEVSVLRDRLDSYEQFLEAQGVAPRAAFEGWSLPAEAESLQSDRRKQLIERILRAVEKIQPVDKSDLATGSNKTI